MGGAVTVNGIEARLLEVSPEQITLQMPVEVGISGEAEFIVTSDGAASSPVRVPLAPATPGIHPMIREADGEITLLVTGFGLGRPPAITLKFDDREVTDFAAEATAGVLTIRAPGSGPATISVAVEGASDTLVRSLLP